MANSVHLVEQFQPEHYDIQLDISRETKKINGTVIVQGNASENQLLLNQKFLKILTVTEHGQSRDFVTDDETELLQVTLNHSGPVSLIISYTTQLTDTMMGIYPSYYEVNGQKTQLVGTQFEATAARQAFPCVDEPAAKATFNLAIKYDEHTGETILSNMPELKCEQGIHYFEQTLRMSTYLIAFVFGDLQKKMSTTKSGVQVGIFATKAHQPAELDFALTIATRTITFYEDYFQTPYPLKHSWHVALPDFAMGAMENWGLVTYREELLLLNLANVTFDRKVFVGTVITHELAHQWFGDLVTMAWWDDLWLNESFANMMEYVALDALEPAWGAWNMFQTDDVPMALKRDATDGVQSVHFQVANPAEIESSFDSAIVYAKGARLLTMTRQLIGDQALRAGLKDYFATHQYANAVGADLWSALSQASGQDIAAIMVPWLEQPGYPVLSVILRDNQVRITQQQFFIGQGVDHGRQWKIPLASNYPEVPALMTQKEIAVADYQACRQANGQPLRLNVDNQSHVVVKYDETLMVDILANVVSLDDTAQRQLLQDLQLLAQGGQISYAELVTLLPRFADSRATTVLTILYDIANSLKRFVTAGSSEEQQLKAYFKKLSTKQVTRLGWQPKKTDTLDDQVVRSMVIRAALYGEDGDAIATAHQLFDKNHAHLIDLPATTRKHILRNEMVHFSQPELFAEFLKGYQEATEASYQKDLGAALLGTSDKKMLAQLATYLRDVNMVKPQDSLFWYSGLLSNPQGEQLAWDWLRENWGWLARTLGGEAQLSYVITLTAETFHTANRLAEFKAFFGPKLQRSGLSRNIMVGIKTIESSVRLVEGEREAVNAEISKQVNTLR